MSSGPRSPRTLSRVTAVALLSSLTPAVAVADAPIPRIPPHSKALVLRVLHASRVTRAGAPFQVAAVGVWTDDSPQQRLLGIAADVTLGRPITGRRSWPEVAWNRRTHTYSRRCFTGEVANASRVTVLVSRDPEALEGVTWMGGTITVTHEGWCRRRGPAGAS
jgi:hypothetical protein